MAIPSISIAAILDPEIIIFGGSIGLAAEDILPAVAARVEAQVPAAPALKVSTLGGRATLLGATSAALALARTVESGRAGLAAKPARPQYPDRRLNSQPFIVDATQGRSSRGVLRTPDRRRTRTGLDSLVDNFGFPSSPSLYRVQRQRYGFAQALACGPELILADEPVFMLDVSIRIGVLNLMADLYRRQGVSFLYITHDIASARYIADRLFVMYAGHVVERGPVEDVLAHPKHPYTQLLLSAVPDPHAPLDPDDTHALGEPPRVVDPGEGCRFRWRCPYAIEQCSAVTPRLRTLRPDHDAACHVATVDESPTDLG